MLLTKTCRVTRVFIFFIALGVLSVAKVSAQNITLSGKNILLEKVFAEIKKQTGFKTVYGKSLINRQKVTIEAKALPLQQFLDKLLKPLRMNYYIENKTIFVRSKEERSDTRTLPLNPALQPAEGKESDSVVKPRYAKLDEVTVKVNSGYQEIEKGRTTGSYEHIDNQLFNRKVGTDIISRIDGIVPGVFFDKTKTLLSVPGQTKIQIRGLSTLTDLNGVDQPLIVVDNFPYEGSLNNINPNDVESITILRDAAASSIWGARAGNGVIVITTKKGKFNQPFKVSANANLTIAEKQAINTTERIKSTDFVDLEIMLFNNDFYQDDISSPLAALSPVVDILLKRRNMQISPEDSATLLNQLRNTDNLNDLRKYYRNEINQQYSLSVSGGSQKASYYFSVGVDKNLTGQKGDELQRISIRSVNTFQPVKNITTTVSIGLTRSNNALNYFGWEGLQINGRKLPPYYRLIDENGQPTSLNFYRNSFLDTVGGGQLLDWQYKPLEQLTKNDFTQQSDAILAGLGLKYNLTKSLSFEGNYQYQKTSNGSRIMNSLESYFTRDLINQFTNLNETNLIKRYPVPIGGILDLSNNTLISQNLRGQLDYNQNWNNNQLTLFAGSEIRKVQQSGNNVRHYGLDERMSTKAVDHVNTFPTILGGTGTISRGGSFSEVENRYVSFYANGQLSIDKKYILTASARNDASNVFGVKTNQKGRPFWSAGTAWILSNEAFYKSDLLPYLKLRVTYGYSGNIDPSVSALTIVNYQSARFNLLTNIPYAYLRSLPNPELRWEKVGQLNAGVDFSFRNKRISGTAEVYQKMATDVLYYRAIDPTSGTTGVKSNSASVKAEGVDVRLNLLPLKLKTVSITTSISLSYVTYKVVDLAANIPNTDFISDGTLFYPRKGLNPYAMAVFKWGGLDPQTGNPIGFLNGKPSTNYDSIANYPTSEDIVMVGSSKPKYFGNLLNTVRWGALAVSANITWQLDYHLVKPSVNYSNLYLQNAMHTDYYKRWMKPGDELKTNVPSMIYPSVGNRDYVYTVSEANLIRGDYFRLEDVRIAYTLQRSDWKKLPVQSVDVFMYLSNLNILLWRANKAGVDPLYLYGLKDPKRFAIGLRMDL